VILEKRNGSDDEHDRGNDDEPFLHSYTLRMVSTKGILLKMAKNKIFDTEKSDSGYEKS
jgi:hypothetical protein